MPTIPETLAASAADRGDAVAIVDQDGRSLTYADWDDRASRIARALSRGVLSDGPVAMWFDDRDWIDAAVGLLGIMRAGGLALPLSSRFHPHEVAAIVEKYSVARLIVGPGLSLPGRDAGARILEFAKALEGPPGETSGERPSTGPQRGCLVYTSGTTGWPRAVRCDHENLAYFLDWRPGFGSEGIIHSFPFDTAAGVLFTIFALTRGPVIRSARLDAGGFLRSLNAHRPRDLMLAPSQMRALIRDLPELAGTEAAKAVRSVVMTAAPTEAALVESVRATFGNAVVINSYSSSEAGIAATNLHYPPAGSPPAGPVHRPEDHPGMICVGYPNEDTEVEVRDETGGRCPPNVVGDVYLRTPRRPLRDYYGPDGAASATVFRDGWVRMGDVGLLDTTGALHLAGRSSDLIDVGGLNVSALQIESVLRTHEGVADVAVFGVADARFGERIAAAVVPRGMVTGRQLHRWVVDGLGEFKAPAHYAFVPEIPLNSMGKVLKRTLRERFEAILEASPDRVASVPETVSGACDGAVADLCAQVLGLDRVDPGDDFFTLGGNSLTATRLVQRFRHAFGVDVPMKALFESPRVADVAALLRSLQRGGTEPAVVDPVTADPAADAAPLEGLLGFVAPEDPSDPREVLLTGGTGFLGAFLLGELLTSTRADVRCLVRAEDDAGAFTRLREALRRYGLWQDGFERRIVPVRGDLADAGLGLTEEDRADLARRVDAIYHCGAVVNVVHPYSRLRAANVDGTKEIIRLADMSGRAPLHYVSTIGVFEGAGRPGRPIGELDPPGPPSAIRQGYAQSKWVGERLVAHAAEAGIPVTIHRPSRIVGHSATGACQTDDYLWRVMKACVQLGSCPADLRSPVDLVPVDYVSAAIVALTTRPGAIGRTFHLVGAEPVEMNRLLEYVRDFGYDLAGVTSAEWLDGVRADPGNAAYPLLSVLHPGETGELGAGSLTGGPGVTFTADATLAGLGGTRIRPVRIDSKIFGRYLSYFVDIGFLPPPGKDAGRQG
ncbi:thioester reductase-like protein [Streptosporangium becharense]|uniref:Thioester reductase-like protein n=1 Tax=Streptosporangium becharense TaxID=1816182 RepID=A0A7W9ILK8_9ACTN|nr:thioester reductase domain-containing protein [Streptosporangium becharense]MBB2910235.1 thioester reductase-like protein [Streptosporangium becharense]MBB5822978.1 thioester reductase-like protein [Streptosporangium becharense]